MNGHDNHNSHGDGCDKVNLIPAQWAVGTIEVDGQSRPVAMVDGAWSGTVTNRGGMRGSVNEMAPGDDAAGLRGSYLILGKPGETSLQPGNPNGWLGQSGSARALHAQYLVLDSGVYEIQAEASEGGVNLQLAPATDVATWTIDLGQVLRKVEAGRRITYANRGTGTTSMTYSKVEPGKTATVTIGGTGRPVVGRIAMPEDARTRATGGWTFGHLSLSSDWLPLPPYPQDRMEMEEEWWLQQRATLQKRLEEMPTPYQVATFQPQPDYSFRIDDVPAGTYMLTVQIYGPASSGQPDMIGVVHRTIEVPATPDGPSDEPLDLGELPLSVGKKANPGELAPSLEVTDVWGKPLRLEDYRGKHLVLVLQWPAMGKKGMEQVKTLYAAVGESEQAAMVSIYCMDRPPVNVKEFLEARQMTWPQAFMDRMEHSAILSSYGFESPATLVLIDPQGRIVAKDLRGKAIEEAVGKAVTAGR